MPAEPFRRRAGRAVAGVLLVAFAIAACAPSVRQPEQPRSIPALLRTPVAPSVAVSPDLHAVRGPIRLPFEENHGQAPADVAFLLRAGSLRAAFGTQQVSYTLIGSDPATRPGEAVGAGSSSRPIDVRTVTTGPVRAYAVTQELVRARPAAPSGSHEAPTRVNYLRWPSGDSLTDVPTFDQLVRADAWPGIDVLYERSGAGVESTYQVAPGADPGQIQLAWYGATAELAEDGSLRLETPLGTLQETAPVSWQIRDGQRMPVAVRWIASDVGLDAAIWGFSLGDYDLSLPLTIDPTVMKYGTFIGGSDLDQATSIAVDGSGAAYLTGSTSSTEATFPTGGGFVGGFDQTYNGGPSSSLTAGDVFVAKLAPNGQSLVYATYIGGGARDFGAAIAVDNSGAAYVAGFTASGDSSFPNGNGFGTGPGSADVPGFNTLYRGGAFDAFVAKLAPDGQSLQYATYLGGNGEDRARGIAIDSNGAAYVTGITSSPPASTPGGGGFAGLGAPVPGFDQTYNGNPFDAFVVKLAPDGLSLDYATYLGGSGDDQASGVAIDSSGAAYIVGYTSSTEATFPNGNGFGTGAGQVDVPGISHSHGGVQDAFVVKLAADGQSLAYATYLGGNDDDFGFAIALDNSGAAYVTGYTASTEATFPIGSPLAGLGLPGFDKTYNGGGLDAFVVKLASTGQALAYVTYLGGGGIDRGRGIAVDSSGNAYVTGDTASPEDSFPNGNGLAPLGAPGFDQTFNGSQDAFVVTLAQDGRTLVDVTYLGGILNDTGNGIVVDGAGTTYIAGLDFSLGSTEPTFPNGSGFAGLNVPGFDQTFNGGGDGFVVKLGPTLTPTPTMTPTPTLTTTPTPTSTLVPPDAPTSTPTATTVSAPPIPTTTPFACGPRPTVSVNATASGPGRLVVTVSTGTAPATPGNHLIQLQVTVPANARLDVPNGPQDQSGTLGLPIGDGTQPVVFFVRRIGPGPITAPIVATDSCGPWPSFVGGGANAF